MCLFTMVYICFRTFIIILFIICGETLANQNEVTLRYMTLQEFWRRFVLTCPTMLPFYGLHNFCCLFRINGTAMQFLMLGREIRSLYMDTIVTCECYVRPKSAVFAQHEFKLTHRLLTDNVDKKNLQQSGMLALLNSVECFYDINMDVKNIILGYFREYEHTRDQVYPRAGH